MILKLNQSCLKITHWENMMRKTNKSYWTKILKALKKAIRSFMKFYMPD